MKTRYYLLLLGCFFACTKKVDVKVGVPSITAVNKTVVAVGDTLVITGSQFSADTADDLVAIGLMSQRVIAATPTQLSVIVPKGTQSGQLTVALPRGQAANFATPISVQAFGAPFITSVFPTSAYGGDTVVVTGGNFTSPSTSLGAFVSGTPCTIFNVSDSVIRMVVSGIAYTGPLTVTANGQTSLPYAFKVLKVDPLADGRIYWFEPVMGLVPGEFGGQVNAVVGTDLFKGKDSSTTFPFADLVFKNSFLDFDGTDQNFDNPIVRDASGRLYYLSIEGLFDQQIYQDTFQYNLIRIDPNSGFSRTVLWSMSQGDPYNIPYTEINFGVPSYPYPQDIPITPQPVIAINGNQLYIKMGYSNTYLTGDVSGSSPVFTNTTGLLDDSVSYGPQFSANYLFYKSVWSSNGYDLDIINLHYMPKGGTVSKEVVLPAGQTILTTLTDPSHGDQILIVTVDGQPAYGAVVTSTIYKFDAGTETLKKLYDKSNWADALAYNGDNGTTPTTTGWLWTGSHIYYANSSRSLTVNEQTGLTDVYNSLYRLNDDGSSTKSYTVYGQMEPGGSPGASAYTFMFIGAK